MTFHEAKMLGPSLIASGIQSGMVKMREKPVISESTFLKMKWKSRRDNPTKASRYYIPPVISSINRFNQVEASK